MALTGRETTLNYSNDTSDYLKFFLCESPHELHKIDLLSEEMKTDQISFIMKKMLNSVRSKSELIDTRDIDNSGGDLKKVQGYERIRECITQLKVISGTIGASPVDSLIELEKNILKNQAAFMEGYKKDNFLIMTLYQTLVMDYFYGTMLYIASVVKPVRDANSFKLSADPRSAGVLVGKRRVFINIHKFNEAFKNGKIKYYFNKANDNLSEEMAFLATVGLAIAAVFFVIFLIRESILLFFKLRNNLSKEFRITSDFLELNSLALKKTNPEVSKRQAELAKTFSEYADAIKIEAESADNYTEMEIKKEVRETEEETGINTSAGEEKSFL